MSKSTMTFGMKSTFLPYTRGTGRKKKSYVHTTIYKKDSPFVAFFFLKKKLLPRTLEVRDPRTHDGPLRLAIYFYVRRTTDRSDSPFILFLSYPAFPAFSYPGQNYKNRLKNI
jgi:hypothetical protein